MSRKIVLALLAAVILVPAAIYVTTRADSDEFDARLRGMGFLPVNPPSTLIDIGSLYYVDSSVRNFRIVCPADLKDMNVVVYRSLGEKVVADALTSGSYLADLKFLRGANSKLSDTFSKRIKYSLTDVNLLEISLRDNRRVRDTLMQDPDCNAAVAESLTSGYVCQGQSLLEANAKYELRAESGDKLDANVDPAEISELKESLTEAVKAESGVELKDIGNTLKTGFALRYGVAMNPTCLAPKGARFSRVLPTNQLQRALNFVKFQLVEKVLPGAA